MLVNQHTPGIILELHSFLSFPF